LFRYVQGCLAFRILVILDNRILLKNEAKKATGDTPKMSFLLDGENYTEFVAQMDSLSHGNLEAEAADFINARKSKVNLTRTQIKDQLAVQPELVAELKHVKREQLPGYLDSQLKSDRALNGLASHLSRLFRRNTAAQIERAARLLKDSEQFKISRALTRAHFYLR
jgi:hypothetical protein